MAALHDSEHSASEEELPFPGFSGVGGAGGVPSSSAQQQEQSLEGLQEQRREYEEEVSPVLSSFHLRG